MWRNNYSAIPKIFFSPKIFFERKNSCEDRVARSDLWVDDPRRVSSVFGLIDLEVGKKRRRLPLEQLQHRDRAPPNFQLGAFARSQLQHRSPGSRVRRP